MIKSYCKINLSLRILKKTNNGLHDIQSNIFLLDLYDDIVIKKIKKKNDFVIFKGKFEKLVSKTNNSVLDTLNLLREKNLINDKTKYKIEINKKIPVFSGLGGGTSNSAFLLKYFIKKKVSNKILTFFEKIIGSDLRLFFNNQSYQKSLKKIFKYKSKFNFFFILVYPNIKCSTKKIYSKVRRYSQSSLVSFHQMKSKKKFIKLIKNEKNDLQEISASRFKIINKVIKCLSNQKGCHFSRMTGSGSVCFGMFNSKKSAILALKEIKKKFPKYWCVVTKTI